MCLAVPGKVLDVQGDDPLLRSGRVSFNGVIKQVSLTCAPDAKVGDYVLVHVGVAISVIDEQEAAETFRYLQAMGDLDGLDPESAPREAPP
ncbi:MAG: HypC/HybG/HupF family hydrogenase formation chaperone [Opitutaceae bacterium]|nr:HypC/HybG/HupF family hydrogenase formation chaperone [Opitutaceae bacterium]